MVNGPRRPMYITNIDNNLLPSDKSTVIPVDKPTVQNALVISNKAWIRETSGSIIRTR